MTVAICVLSVAHLGQKEGGHGGAEHAKPGPVPVSASSILSGISIQTAIATKEQPSAAHRRPERW
jgi:hypothetical protein